MYYNSKVICSLYQSFHLLSQPFWSFHESCQHQSFCFGSIINKIRICGPELYRGTSANMMTAISRWYNRNSQHRELMPLKGQNPMVWDFVMLLIIVMVCNLKFLGVCVFVCLKVEFVCWKFSHNILRLCCLCSETTKSKTIDNRGTTQSVFNWCKPLYFTVQLLAFFLVWVCKGIWGSSGLAFHLTNFAFENQNLVLWINCYYVHWIHL